MCDKDYYLPQTGTIALLRNLWRTIKGKEYGMVISIRTCTGTLCYGLAWRGVDTTPSADVFERSSP